MEVRVPIQTRKYEIYERLGYYDQAHFIKDFKKNTSLTPSRFERANSQYKIV